jgi:hypothetical protein
MVDMAGAPGSAEVACVLALAETVRVHGAVGRRWEYAIRKVVGPEEEAAEAEAEEDRRGGEGARRIAVSVADTGSTAGSGEAAGQSWET